MLIFVVFVFLFIRMSIDWDWWIILLCPPGLYFIYAGEGNRAINLIIISEDRIEVPRALSPISPIQYKVDVLISDIVIIDFVYACMDSRGERVAGLFRENRYLFLTLADESIARIHLQGYTKEQIRQIEKTLLEIKPDILVYHPASFITK